MEIATAISTWRSGSASELLAKMAVDWEGLQLSAVEPTEQAMAQVQAEKKAAVAKELREDRPETKGIALLRSAIAPAQAEAAAEPEEGYQESRRRIFGTRTTLG